MNSIIKNGYSFIKKECQNGFFNCYLSSSRRLDDFTDCTLSKKEIGSSALVLMLSSKKNKINKKIASYLAQQIEEYKFYFFEDKTVLPADADTSAWILSTLLSKEELPKNLVIKAAKIITDNVNSEKLILVYYEPCYKENWLDHTAMTNILYLLNQTGTNQLAEPTLNHVINVLQNKEYLKGSRYYSSPLMFLYFFSRLFDFEYFQQFKKIVKEQLIEIPPSEDPLDLAYKIIIAKKLNMKCDQEIELLVKQQAKDGGWPFDAVYRFGKKEIYFGSRAITTAFALHALEN